MKPVAHFARQLVILLSILASIGPQLCRAAPIMRGMQVGNQITAADIPTLASWRVNIIRWQLIWGPAADSASLTDYNNWLEGAVEYVENLLPVFAQYNIKVVLVLQSPPGGIAYYSPDKTYRIFREQSAQQRFLDIWSEFATRFKDNSTIWGYELLNEPAVRPEQVATGLLGWNDLALETTQRIRAIDTTHRILIEPIYGAQGRLKDLAILPASLGPIVYSPHLYWPPQFIQQKKGYTKYPTAKYNKAYLKLGVAGLIKFMAQVAKVDPLAAFFITELSVNGATDDKSASAYMADLFALFSQYKWSWTFHAFREADVWNVELTKKSSHFVPASKPTARLKALLKQFKKNNF